ncbi:hypothetical protein [Paenisporosarcina sp. OV554]|uniref:hypothetical protein n=1 Tax=Paenisporosarcina sp. OV554 TaxID=2135694 RepID=UPI000D4E52DA|nr:hypothetical protein [Paenisporosarcina sp. OV554]PUB12899.1 hypothetical protein C8K15_10812 [Paenisporosarcina sp. OV554]
MGFLVSDSSVGKYGRQVGKNVVQVGKFEGQVGKIAIQVGIEIFGCLNEECYTRKGFWRRPKAVLRFA